MVYERLGMRLYNILRNSCYSMLSFALVAIMGLVIRRFFVEYFSVELLGLEELFINLVTVLSMAEMGLTSIISYGLYKELANKNEEEICVLMNIYRYIYSLIGGFIIIIAVFLFFFLDYIVPENTLQWQYVQWAFIIQIGTIISSYFLAYKRILLRTDQKEYISIRIDTICSLLSNVMKILTIIVLQNYFLYASIGLVFNIVANYVISRKVNAIYAFFYRKKVCWQDIVSRNITKDIKNLMVQKMAMLLYGGIDSIYVSWFCGLATTGLMANYELLNRALNSVMHRMLEGVIPSIGNLVYENDKNNTIRIYRVLDFGYMLFAGIVACLYLVGFQPFIRLFFGDNLLLSNFVVFGYAVYIFIGIQFENACNFRNVFGDFEKDRNFMTASGIIKAVLAIPLVSLYGVTGLIASSTVAWFFIGYGRIRVVFDRIFSRSYIKKYLFKHFIWSVLSFVEVYVVYLTIHSFFESNNYLELVLSCLTACVEMSVLHCIFFFWCKEREDFVHYSLRVIRMVIGK